MKRAALILLALLTVACPARRGGGGGGGGDDDDAVDGPGPEGFFEVDIEGETVPNLSAIYVEEDLLAQGFTHQIVATEGMTCAGYRDYWAVVGPVYEELARTMDFEGFEESFFEAMEDIPGLPGWLGTVTLPEGFRPGDGVEGAVSAEVTRYRDEGPEEGSALPFGVGAKAVLEEASSGSIDTLGDDAEGTVSGTGGWYADYNPAGPNTAQDREVTFTFSAARCDLDDLELIEP